MTEATEPDPSIKAIREAKQQMDFAVDQYINSNLYGSGALASSELHTKVLSLYWRMLAHLEGRDGWEDASDLECVEGDIIWQGYHPTLQQNATIKGLKDVKSWINRSVKQQKPSTGPRKNTSKESEQVPVVLTGDAALTIAEVLNKRFESFGWDAQIDHPTPEDKPKPEHLVGLLNRRDQKESVDQLPARFQNAVTDGGEKNE